MGAELRLDGGELALEALADVADAADDLLATLVR